MSLKNKIIWSEGMFLRPQHFQQQDRHLKSWIDSRCSATQPYAWGIAEIEIDPQLLALGKVAIKSARGVFSDGTPFNIPDQHPAPAPLDIPADTKTTVVSLAIPLHRTTGSEVAAADDADSLERYSKQQTTVKDFHSNLDNSEAEIELGELRFRLLLDSEDQGAYTGIPITRIIERTPDDLVILDEHFIASCISKSGSSRLVSYIQEIHGLLHHRCEELSKRLASPGAGGVGEIVDFLLLQIINRYKPLFAHYTELSVLHPEQLYRILLQMAGELATITRSSHAASEFPAYRHAQLTETFTPVIAELRKSLNWVPDARAISIELEEHRFGVKTATIGDKELLRSAEFVLAVNAQVPTEKIQHNFPHQTTISTVEKLRDLVMTHTPGIEIRNLAVAPRQIPYHAGFSYFVLEKSGNFWAEIEKTGTLAMHFAGEYPELEVELWAIKA